MSETKPDTLREEIEREMHAEVPQATALETLIIERCSSVARRIVLRERERQPQIPPGLVWLTREEAAEYSRLKQADMERADRKQTEPEQS